MTSDLNALAGGLAAGVNLQRAGRHTEAEQAYRRLITLFPSHPDILQLLGVALKAQGKLAEAEERLRQSLKGNPAQPHVWGNLGNLLSDLGRYDEAVDSFAKALVLDLAFVEALIGLGGAHLSMGRLAEAADAYRRAKVIQPQNRSAAIGLASVAMKQHDAERAEGLLREVIAIDPTNPTALYNLGMNHATLGDASAAQPLIERAVALRPGRADMLTGLGYALQIGGDTNAAVARYREAIAANPHHLAAYENLARLLWQGGQRQSYLDDLDAAIAKFPNMPALHIARANLLGLAQRYADARESFAAAHALNPTDPAALDGLARMSMECGDATMAHTYHDRAVAAAPAISWLRTSRAHTSLRAGNPDEAARDLESVLAVDPANQLALADLALAWRMLGDSREEWLADFERFAATIEVPPPRGYSDMAVFNSDLNRTLDDLHHLQVEPIDQTLRRGTQTLGNLFGRKLDLVTRLRERFDDVARAYAAALPADAAHPFLRRKSTNLSYRGSWSARLKSSGYHVTHIHPAGWISSAYYVALPAEVSDTARKQGWFTLGDPPFDVPWTDRVRRYVQPREGMLVLFPSYFYHGTVPFDGDRARTTIAFDMAPQNA